MNKTYTWYLLAGAGLTIVLGGVAIWFTLTSSEPEPEPVIEETAPDPEPIRSTKTIGTSAEEREILVHTFGDGDTRILLVGGVHGGYEWNSILLAYQMIDFFVANPEEVPSEMTIDIIPNLNPDGLYAATGLSGRFSATDITDYSMHTTGKGRFNANDVDLNRNFACKWAPESSWRGKTVSAGSEPFSEPEAQALRNQVETTNPQAVIFWHSKANNVYASECHEGPLPLTLEIMNAYAEAGNYGAIPVFDAYPITGDAEGWLASIGIPAITVELEGRTTTEWSRNLAGTKAVIDTLSQKLAR